MGDSASTTKRRARVVAAALVGSGALIVLQPAISSARSAPPSIVCEVDVVTFGEPVTCTASGDDVVALAWPDGAMTEPAVAHVPVAVGALEVRAVDADGATLTSASIHIDPDISLECGASDEPKIVYELASTDLRPEGWDYVYLDPITGERVSPGDPAHPGQAPTGTLDRIELDTAPSTSICRLTSAAAEALDGTYELTLESEWEPTMTTQQRIMGPASKTKWAGAQPGTLTGTVTIGAVTASERVGVYLAGCA